MEIVDNAADLLGIDAGMDDDHFMDRAGCKDVPQGMGQDRFAAQRIKELIPLVTEAAPCAGRYHDDRYFHTFHLLICDFYEYHASGRRLKDRRHRNRHIGADIFLAVFETIIVPS